MRRRKPNYRVERSRRLTRQSCICRNEYSRHSIFVTSLTQLRCDQYLLGGKNNLWQAHRRTVFAKLRPHASHTIINTFASDRIYNLGHSSDREERCGTSCCISLNDPTGWKPRHVTCSRSNCSTCDHSCLWNERSIGYVQRICEVAGFKCWQTWLDHLRLQNIWQFRGNYIEVECLVGR